MSPILQNVIAFLRVYAYRIRVHYSGRERTVAPLWTVLYVCVLDRLWWHRHHQGNCVAFTAVSLISPACRQTRGRSPVSCMAVVASCLASVLWQRSSASFCRQTGRNGSPATPDTYKPWPVNTLHISCLLQSCLIFINYRGKCLDGSC